MSRKPKLSKIGRSDKAARHVRLHHWVMETAAWQSLSVTDRALYIELSRRYSGPGTNNGRIPYSIREAAEHLHVGKTAAAESFARLQGRGFIAVMRKGKFDRKTKHSSEWRLTEHPCDVTGGLATKDFVRWQPPKEKTVPEGGPDGISERTLGPSERTASLKKPVYGI
jgi:hypothetical protein